MVQLTEKDSFPHVEDSADRHVALCLQCIGGEKYKNLLTLFYDDFVLQHGLMEAATKKASFALDVSYLYEDIVDDTIRKVQGRAKEYDNDHAGSELTRFILPDGNITPIIDSPVKKKLEKAHDVSLKLASLGNTHTLFPLAAEVQTAVDTSNAKIKIYDDAKKDFDNAVTAAVISKAALVSRYNANYFEAASDVNKSYAEKLFPRIHRSPKDDSNNPKNGK